MALSALIVPAMFLGFNSVFGSAKRVFSFWTIGFSFATALSLFVPGFLAAVTIPLCGFFVIALAADIVRFIRNNSGGFSWNWSELKPMQRVVKIVGIGLLVEAAVGVSVIITRHHLNLH